MKKKKTKTKAKRENTAELFSLSEYDRIIVSFSGGKDSLACVLNLLETHPEVKGKVELWHQDIDGREGDRFMDWPVTPGYCRAVAKALDLPVYFQWKIGGFEREMLREDSYTEGVRYEARDGSGKIITLAASGLGTQSTRRKFPQVSADLMVRWCSAYLKIDVARRVINAEFNGTKENPVKILMITGERAEESAARSRYAEVDLVNQTKKRIVHQWRSIQAWSEKQVWAIIERHGINPHPAYHLGWGRVSCMACIFGQANQWASVKSIAPKTFSKVAAYEEEFGFTIKRGQNVNEQAEAGTVFPEVFSDKEQAALALSEEYPEEAVRRSGEWKMPAGAFRACGGPV